MSAANALVVYAGQKAMQHIQRNGLNPSDISSVIGASGAAKWLAIAGLDRAVFADWLPQSDHTIDVLGTSIGAFKLAAALRNDPAQAINTLADDYIAQSYGPEQTLTISEGTAILLEHILAAGGAEEILSSDRFRYHCVAVRCLGGLASEEEWPQKLAMAGAFFRSLTGRRALTGQLQRIVFSDPRSQRQLQVRDGYHTERAELSAAGFANALLASGSIPVYMDAVKDEAGQVLRDGGLLDYHPVPAYFWQQDDGITLYPHFYRELKAGWFDKFFPWRRVPAALLDNVVMLSPSESHIAALPDGKIPERQDFIRFQHDETERRRRWRLAVERSECLGEEFLRLVESDQLASVVQPFPA
jgi:hypothetical protein